MKWRYFVTLAKIYFIMWCQIQSENLEKYLRSAIML